MAELVNVFDNQNRGTVEKESPIKGAFVTFFDDSLADEWKEISKNEDTAEGGYAFTKMMIESWNFANQDGKELEITVDNIKRLPFKTQAWLANTAVEILQEVVKVKKESPAT